MTKLAIMSDLHLETGNRPEDVIPTVIPDVYVLAGDIHNGAGATTFLRRLLQDAPVIYIPGNHEYYGGVFPDTFHKMQMMEEALNVEHTRNLLANRLYLLDKKMVEVKGVRFIGATLWTDFDGGNAMTMMAARHSMRDFKGAIKRPDGRNLIPDDAFAAHCDAIDYLGNRLPIQFDGKTVVVTHHSPSFMSVAEEFKDDDLNPAFHSNLDDFILKYKPAIWIHGHTHHAMDYMLGDTRIICNPYGYPHESRIRQMGYSRDKIIEL